MLIVAIAITDYENNHIVVRKQIIAIEDLPDEFEGYTFLQISDLHGKSFGKKQEQLIRLISETKHDAILLTGDMNKGIEEMPCQAIMDLIDGLQGECMYWTDGNCGPYTMEKYQGKYTGRLLDAGKILKDKGVCFLNEPITLVRGNSQIYLIPKMATERANKSFIRSAERFIKESDWDEIESFNKDQKEWFTRLHDKTLVIIAVDHYPEQTYLSAAKAEKEQKLPYDLIICGHTHGGQIRIPFIGAVYIPVVSSGSGGWFPRDEDTRGLSWIEGIPQYISAGLGSSSSIPFLAFRFFCPPEINMITLEKKTY
jgi:hypothetical protein